MKMGLGAAGGHDHHVDMFFIDEFENLLGRIAEGDMTNKIGTIFEVVAAYLIQPFAGFLVLPGHHLVNVFGFKIAIPFRVVQDRVVDDIQHVDFGVVFAHQGFDGGQGLLGPIGEIRRP